MDHTFLDKPPHAKGSRTPSTGSKSHNGSSVGLKSSSSMRSSGAPPFEISSSMRKMDDTKTREEERYKRIASEVRLIPTITELVGVSSNSISLGEIESFRLSAPNTVIYIEKSTKPSPLVEIRGKRDLQIDETLKRIKNAQQVDICFLLDCTGSMDSYIEATKKTIFKILLALRENNKHLQIWVAFVGYRDFCDKVDRLAFLDFTQVVKMQKEVEMDLKMCLED